MIDLAPGRDVTQIVEAAAAAGVLVAEWSAARVRMVTHLDVSAAHAVHAGEVVRDVLELAR